MRENSVWAGMTLLRGMRLIEPDPRYWLMYGHVEIDRSPMLRWELAVCQDDPPIGWEKPGALLELCQVLDSGESCDVWAVVCCDRPAPEAGPDQRLTATPTAVVVAVGGIDTMRGLFAAGEVGGRDQLVALISDLYQTIPIAGERRADRVHTPPQ